MNLQTALRLLELLFGAHVRLIVRPGLSVILSIQKVLGAGNRTLGRTFIHDLISPKRTTAGEYSIFNTLHTKEDDSISEGVTQPLLGLAYTVCAHQVSRIDSVDLPKSENANFAPLPIGECWRDVFEDVVALDLSAGFRRLSVAMNISITPIVHKWINPPGCSRECIRGCDWRQR